MNDFFWSKILLKHYIYKYTNKISYIIIKSFIVNSNVCSLFEKKMKFLKIQVAVHFIEWNHINLQVKNKIDIAINE